MITGLGVDIVEIDRMKATLERRPAMKERLFSDAERAYCDKRNKPEIHYAMRFAAKEAVLKALGTGFKGMRFKDVEVMRDETGKPVPHLKGRAAEVAEVSGDSESAIAACEEAIEADPRFCVPYRLLGHIRAAAVLSPPTARRRASSR